MHYTNPHYPEIGLRWRRGPVGSRVMTRRTIWRCALLAAFTLSASGGVFQLEITPASHVEAGRITIHVGMVNQGDEDMHNVQAAVRFEGLTNAGPVRAVLQPGETNDVELDAGALPAIRGRYTAMVTARYTDRYGHPFMTLEPIPVYTAEPPDTPALQATLSRMSMGAGLPLTLALTSLDTRDLEAHCRLMLPDELLGRTLERTVTIPAHGTAQVTFDVANAWATGDSHYRVYAVIDTIRDARHESLVAPGLVTIPARRTLAPTTIKRLWLVPGGLFLAYLLAQILARCTR